MKHLMEYEDLKAKLLSIPDKTHRGFLCLTYASLGRVGEVLRHKNDGLHTTKYVNPPISAENVRLTTSIKGHKIVTIQLLTEKVGRTRIVPVFPQFEKWLIMPFWNIKKDVKQGFMFDYSVRWGQKVYEKYFNNQNIHSLRHWRITHLLNGSVTGTPIQSHIVARMSGHTRLSSQSAYDHSVMQDYIDDLIGGD